MENQSATLPYRRFRENQPTGKEIIEYARLNRYVWYHAPMDSGPRKVYLTSKIKTWKRDPDKFEFSVVNYAGFDTLRWRIDNAHADRIRIPNPQWWHGLTASVYHIFCVDGGITWCAGPKGYLRKHGTWNGCVSVPVTEPMRKQICLHQSNGFVLNFDSLKSALNFARRQNFRLTAGRGRRVKVLVRERPMNGEVE